MQKTKKQKPQKTTTKKHHSVSFTSREFFLSHMDQTGVEHIWEGGGREFLAFTFDVDFKSRNTQNTVP